MYRILFNGNLVCDNYGRPMHFNNEYDAEKYADEISDNNPKYTVVVLCVKQHNIRIRKK